MFCPNCGKDVGEGRFCESCGFDMESSTQNQEQKEEFVQDQPTQRIVKKPRKPLTKNQKIMIGLGVLLVIGIGLFYRVGGKYSTPMKAAKEYQKAYNQHNWEKVYELTAVDESKYVTKELFVEAMKAKEASLTNMQNPTSSTYTAGALGANVTYGIMGTTKSFVKEDGKRFIFFSKWKSKDFAGVCDMVSIQVPYLKGAKATLDGVSLDEALVKDDDSKFYAVDSVLEGKHTIKYTNVNGCLQKTEYTLDTSDVDSVKLEYTATAKENAKNSLVNALRAMMPSLIRGGTSYNAISEYFVSDTVAQNFFENCHKGDAVNGAKANMNDFNYEISSEESTIDGVDVYVNGSASYESTNMFSGYVSISNTFTMQYVDGKWLIRSW